MSFLRSWLLGILVASAVLRILYALIPKGKFLAVARFSGGLILLLVMLRPLLHLEPDFLLNDITSRVQDVKYQTQAIQAQQQDALSASIADSTAAYIQEKAASLGVACRPDVSCEIRDGVPFPNRIQWDIPYNGALEHMAETDLGVPASRQIWQEVRP